MAGKIKKSFNATIQGILDIKENGILFVDVEDIGEIPLSDFIKDFNSKEIKLSVSYSNDDF